MNYRIIEVLIKNESPALYAKGGGLLPVLLILLGCLPLLAQKPLEKVTPFTELTLRRQIIADDLENQSKGIPFAAVRVLVKQAIASWLWKKKSDDTGRAEPLAVAAFEDLYGNKADIPELYFSTLSRDIFSLLDAHEKQTAAKLSLKYDRTEEDKLASAEALLDQKGGEKIVTDKIIEALDSTAGFSFMTSWLMDELRTRNSPELYLVLLKIVVMDETGRSKLSDQDLFDSADFLGRK